MRPSERAHAFLHDHGMHPDDLDLARELDRLRANLKSGLAGHATARDCQMQPAYVTVERKPPLGRRVLALDAGGTNLRAALVTFTPEGPRIEGLRTRPIPGLGAPVRRAQFLAEIAQFAAPLAEQAEALGFCFSYQAEILPNGDGRVIQFSKEVVVPDGSGMLVCQELLDAFAGLGGKAPSSFALVNDTVAALLGGCIGRQDPADGQMGFILGTGTNLCYVADTAHLHRPLNGWTAPTMIVNVESGVYSGFPQGTFDRELDAESMSPGEYGNEKMVGGAYQGEVLRRTLWGAASLFSAAFQARLEQAGPLTAADLSAFAAGGQTDGALAALCSYPEDREVLAVFADCLLERAARLVAVTLAGPMEEENMGRTAPTLVVAEGSTFWKNPVLRHKIEVWTERFLHQQLGRRCTFVRAEHPNLTGAALAALQRHST